MYSRTRAMLDKSQMFHPKINWPIVSNRPSSVVEHFISRHFKIYYVESDHKRDADASFFIFHSVESFSFHHSWNKYSISCVYRMFEMEQTCLNLNGRFWVEILECLFSFISVQTYTGIHKSGVTVSLEHVLSKNFVWTISNKIGNSLWQRWRT